MKNLIFNNSLQKLLAVCCAIVIWIFAPAPDKKNLSEIQFFVPVSYVNLPKNLEIISQPLQTISLSVEVPRNKIQEIHPSLFQVAIDLEDALPGKTEYEISQKFLKAPPNVKILRISPNTQEIEFERTIEKELPIQPVIIGEPAKGYVLKKVKMVPSSIKVRGPISKLQNIQQLETKAIDISNLNSHIDLITQVLFPERVTIVSSKPEYFAAQIQVGSEPINLLFKNIPIGIVNQTFVTRINPKYFNVLLRGPRSLMDNFSKQDVQAFIDVKNYLPGKYKIKAPTLRLRPEIQIQKIWPPIHIWVKKERND